MSERHIKGSNCNTGQKQSSVNISNSYTTDSCFDTGQEQSSLNISNSHTTDSCFNTRQEQNEKTELQSFN